jgi:hypothetical protein
MIPRRRLDQRTFDRFGRVLRVVAAASLVGVTGCARGCTSSRPPIHINPSMYDQPKVLPQTANDFFYNGASMRDPVPGTVALDGLKENTPFFTGKGADGQFQRGNVPTASFHQEKILKYPDGQIFDVMTNGQGLMPSYRWPIPPGDRWAIIAYVRDLERKRLANAPPPSADATVGKPANGAAPGK